MKTLAIAAWFTLGLAGCVSTTAAQKAENTDTTALSTYATIGGLIDAYEVPKCGAKFCDPKAEGYRTQAWGVLNQEHTFYTSGQFASALTQLQALEALVATVKGL